MLLSCNFKCSQPIAPLDLSAGFIQARTIASSMGRACRQAQRTQGATRRRIVGSLCDQSSAQGVVKLHFMQTRESHAAPIYRSHGQSTRLRRLLLGRPRLHPCDSLPVPPLPPLHHRFPCQAGAIDLMEGKSSNAMIMFIGSADGNSARTRATRYPAATRMSSDHNPRDDKRGAGIIGYR